MDIVTGNNTGVSWGAVFAGAAVATATSLILLLLGFGLGLSVISPFAGEGAEMSTIGIGTAIWLALTHILASGLGGYLAGRLRVKWPDVDRDEVYFRDTANGFITWAVATLIAIALTISTATSILAGGARVGEMAGTAVGGLAGAAGSAASQGADSNFVDYFVDGLLRDTPDAQDMQEAGEAVRRELATIFQRNLLTGEFDQEDRQYLASVIARYTNMSPGEAEARVNELINRAEETMASAAATAREAADTARKAAAYSSLWIFIAFLMGAFAASFLGTFGGRQRDAF
jgi:hypothetical protein